ncbi:MAG: hypothetical protein M0P09_01290 [Acholeplasmataceae bacterium]|nr:hypothetical protein [Acholeplasmataceae bacterium]
MTIRIPPKTKKDAADSTEALKNAAAGATFDPMPHIADSAAEDLPTLVSDHNALLAALQAAGLMEESE